MIAARLAENRGFAMAFIRNLGIAFACGFVGALVLYAALIVTDRVGLAGVLQAKPIPVPALTPAIYALGAWGGIWALLLALPVVSRIWLIRGVVVGIAATAGAIWLFKMLPPTFTMDWVYVGILNIIWGVASALFYRVVSIEY
jgi:hypothetical protein